MPDLFDFMQPSAADLATIGMQRAVDHADQVEGGWSELAYAMLEQYAFSHCEFMTEDVRVWAHENGLAVPPDKRAWGAVTLRAVREKLVVCDRYRKTRIPPAHATPRPVWRSQIWQEAA
jgi:hypothetical protein